MARKKKKSKKRNIFAVIAIIVFLVGAFYLFGNPCSKFKIALNAFSSAMVDRGLLKEAEKYLSDYDYIICYDTMRIVWVNAETTKLIGLTPKEVMKLRTFDVTDKDYDKAVVLSRVLNRMVEKKGDYEPVIEAKDGTHVKLSVTYRTFNYNEGVYIVGKVTTHKVISEEEAAEIISDEEG